MKYLKYEMWLNTKQHNIKPHLNTNKITQRLDNDTNGLGSKPKFETRHKRAQGPNKTKQVARTKWGVYSCPSLRIIENQE